MLDFCDFPESAAELRKVAGRSGAYRDDRCVPDLGRSANMKPPHAQTSGQDKKSRMILAPLPFNREAGPVQ
jgi:hypothetical protein